MVSTRRTEPKILDSTALVTRAQTRLSQLCRPERACLTQGTLFEGIQQKDAELKDQWHMFIKTSRDINYEPGRLDEFITIENVEEQYSSEHNLVRYLLKDGPTLQPNTKNKRAKLKALQEILDVSLELSRYPERKDTIVRILTKLLPLYGSKGFDSIEHFTFIAEAMGSKIPEDAINEARKNLQGLYEKDLKQSIENFLLYLLAILERKPGIKESAIISMSQNDSSVKTSCSKYRVVYHELFNKNSSSEVTVNPFALEFRGYNLLNWLGIGRGYLSFLDKQGLLDNPAFKELLSRAIGVEIIELATSPTLRAREACLRESENPLVVLMADYMLDGPDEWLSPEYVNEFFKGNKFLDFKIVKDQIEKIISEEQTKVDSNKALIYEQLRDSFNGAEILIG